jgi:hypothetical protein
VAIRLTRIIDFIIHDGVTRIGAPVGRTLLDYNSRKVDRMLFARGTTRTTIVASESITILHHGEGSA